MSALTALALCAGLVSSLGALWVDHAVSRQQTGRSCVASLVVSAGLGVLLALVAYLATQDPILTAAGMATATAISVAVSTDLRFGLLADLTSVLIAAGALAAAPLLTPGLSYLEMILSALTATGILALAGLYGRLRRGVFGLGTGDLLFAAALGLWCPTVTAALGVAIGALLTLAVGLLLHSRAHTRLPFGPGLAAGFVIAFVLDHLT